MSDHQQIPQPAPKKIRTPQPTSERNHTSIHIKSEGEQSWIGKPQSTTASSSSSTSQSSHQEIRPRRKYAVGEIPIHALMERDGHRHIPKRPDPMPPPVAASPVSQNGVPPLQPGPSPIQPGPHGGPFSPPRRSNLEASLDNHEPYNDMSRLVANWLWDHVVAAPDYGPGTHIEVEAKLGELQHNGVRIRIPIQTEAVVTPGSGAQFKSSMGVKHHKRLNDYLNVAVRNANTGGRVPMTYKHTVETDKLYDLPTHMLARSTLPQAVKDAHLEGGKPARVRVTRNNKTNVVTAAIIKLRMADLEVFCPSDEFDIRISVSLETAWPHPIDGLPEQLDGGVPTGRSKDRVSYTHQGFQVDLTQVTQLSGTNRTKTHELEIELDTNQLKGESDKIGLGVANNYEELVGCFLNNMRVVNRAARTTAPPQNGS